MPCPSCETADLRALDEKTPNAATAPPLRVLFVQHTAELSGSTISGQLVARGLRQAGWHVDVAFGVDGDASPRYAELGCAVHFVPHKNWLRGGNVMQSIRRTAVEVGGSRAFMKLIRECRPDVVYVNTIVSLAAAVAAWRLRIPCVWHIRELFEDVGGEMRVPALGGRTLVRRVIGSFADQVVSISEAVRENILGDGRSGNVSVVPNAADEKFFELAAGRAQCRSLFDLPTDGLIIGVPGTLRPMKGHAFFLEAAARVAAEGLACRFAITGDGEPKYVEQLRRQAERLGLAPHVSFLGTVARMPEFYRACDLVCIPSRAEPFGRTVIEAFATGVPVVASAVGGILETVAHDRTGLLVDYGDVPGLAGSLVRLARDAGLRERLAAAAGEQARRRYSADAYFERINGIVEQTFASRQVRSRNPEAPESPRSNP